MRALVVNCTLKKSPEVSNTEALATVVIDKLRAEGVDVTEIRAVDKKILPGVESDMAGGDECPPTRAAILESEILVIATPTWMARPASVTQRVLERMDAMIAETDDSGHPLAYGKVAGVVVTGNEDGAHHVISEVMGALIDIGFTIPAQAWTYWNRGPGPGKSYLEDDSGHEWSRTTGETAAQNLVAGAKALAETPLPVPIAGEREARGHGVPARGIQRGQPLRPAAGADRRARRLPLRLRHRRHLRRPPLHRTGLQADRVRGAGVRRRAAGRGGDRRRDLGLVGRRDLQAPDDDHRGRGLRLRRARLRRVDVILGADLGALRPRPGGRRRLLRRADVHLRVGAEEDPRRRHLLQPADGGERDLPFLHRQLGLRRRRRELALDARPGGDPRRGAGDRDVLPAVLAALAGRAGPRRGGA